MIAFTQTDIGQCRSSNQDTVYYSGTPVGSLPCLGIVADGMGGHNAGEIASRFAVEEFIKLVEQDTSINPIMIMNRALTTVNEELFKRSLEDKDLAGMGTTIVIAAIMDQSLYVANVGDSRLYVIGEHIRQITRDHSLVEEMISQGKLERYSEAYYQQKNIITRAVGVTDHVTADYFEIELTPQDIVLLCSDGLTNMLTDQEIFTVVKEHEDLEKAGRELIELANQNGGKDNVSIVLIKPETDEVKE